jgi:DNA end-binding protein Ku
MYTLRHASEVRAMGSIDELGTVPAKIKPDEIKLARQVISNFETEGDLTQYKDDYQTELRKIIEAKIAGEEIVAPKDEAPPKVVNLMDALRQSLERVSTTKKRTARIAETRGEKAVSRAPLKKRARG